MTDERFFELCKFERQLKEEGYTLIAGIDEAGRGPLAGPVSAACVILKPDGPFVRGVDDSKKLSEKRRESLFEEIKETSFAYGISFVDNKRIDEINILQATYEAMRNALKQAIEMAEGKAPGMLLVDHVHIPEIEIPQMSITHGDAQSISIGSASILAKVARDRLMKEYDEKYPEYGFAKHKGYGTKAHYDAIAQYGLSEIHRKTFLKKLFN